MSEPFDLSAFDGLVAAQETGIDVEIRGPDGKKLGKDGFTIRMAGPDSSRFKAAEEELRQEMIDSKDVLSESEIPRAELEEKKLRILAKCTISWSPVLLDGAPIECTEANAAKLYARHPFIRDQVIGAAGGRRSFMPRSAKGSAGRSSSATPKSATASPQ